MRASFTQSFKIQAVEKALSRPAGVTLNEIAAVLGIGQSTLGKWIIKAKHQGFESTSHSRTIGTGIMTSEKRPQDWTLEERLQMVIACGALDEAATNTMCRQQGLFPHHVAQWKADFANGTQQASAAKQNPEIKTFKHEIKTLRRELNRKDRALAETAALLVLQKKVQAIWGNDEDDSL
jgi:transposase-like protein